MDQKNTEKENLIFFHVNWGLIHPNYIDINFIMHVFKNHPYMILTGDWDFDKDVIFNWDKKSQFVSTQKNGKELLFIVYPNIKL